MYRFRLETLRRRRKQIEDQRQTELSAQRVAFEQASRTLDRGKRLRSKLRRKLKDKLAQRSTIADLITFQSYLHRLSDDLENQKKVVATEQKKVDERQARLIDAVKSRKILDKLKEKQSVAHERRSAQKEQSLMNEIAGNRHLRRRQPV